MSKTVTLQVFVTDLLARIDDPSKPVLTSPLSGILPTDGNYRTDMARYRGSLADRAAAQSRSHEAFAIKTGAVLTEGEGANGTSVAGQSAFMVVSEDDIEPLGVGTSAEIRERFAAWVAAQG